MKKIFIQCVPKNATKLFDFNFVMGNHNSVFSFRHSKYMWEISSDVAWGWSNENTTWYWAKRKFKGISLWDQINCWNPTTISKTFAVRKASHRKTIWRIGERFLTERNVHNFNKERCSKTRGARTQQSMEAVRLSAFQSLKKFLPTTLPRVGSKPDEDSP